MIKQKQFSLRGRPKGFHPITSEIICHLGSLPQIGMLHLFIKHTSAALTINENADSDVPLDLNSIFDKLIPENEPSYRHTAEGKDDMPAHAKSTLCGSSLTVPITAGKLNLGTWQGIFLCEFRENGGPRKIVATILE